MAIRVPVQKYDQQISPVTPKIQNAPSVPKLNLSPGLSAINKIGQANVELGETVAKVGQVIAKHAQQRQLEIDEADVSARESSFRLDLQNILYDKEMETKTVEGQEMQVPRGLMNRQLDQSDGITRDFDARFSDLKQKYLSGLRTKDQWNAMAKSLDGNYLSSRNMIINHEGDQFRKSLINKHEMNAKQVISSGSTISDTPTLLTSIDNLDGLVNKMGNVNGQDAETIAFNQKDKASDLVQNSVESFLQNTGNLDGAIKLLNSVKDRILPDKYQDIKEKLRADKRTIDRLAKDQLDIQKDSLYTKYFDGTLTLQDVYAVNKPIEKGGIGGKAAVDLKNKLIKAQNTELKDITTDDSAAEKYVTLVNEMVKDDITNFDLKELMIDYHSDGIITGEEANKMAEIKKVMQDMKWNKSSGMFVNSVKAIKSWFGANNPDDKALGSALRKLVNSGVSQSEEQMNKTTQDIIRQEQISVNPKLGLLPDLPNQTIREDGTVNTNMPGLRNLKNDNSVKRGNFVIKIDPVTNVKARVWPDGSYEVIDQ